MKKLLTYITILSLMIPSISYGMIFVNLGEPATIQSSTNEIPTTTTTSLYDNYGQQGIRNPNAGIINLPTGGTSSNSACNPDIISWYSQYNCANQIREQESASQRIQNNQTLLQSFTPANDVSTSSDSSTSTEPTIDAQTNTTIQQLQKLVTLQSLLQQLVSLLKQQLENIRNVK